MLEEVAASVWDYDFVGEKIIPMVMEPAMVQESNTGFKWTEELEEKYGDPEDPESKSYIPPGWKTNYLWRAPDLWFQMNSEWMSKTAMIFLGLRLMDVTILAYFGYSMYTSYSAYS